MALDPRFVVTQDLDSYLVDKDSGLPLAGGIITFYEDSARTILKTVYTLTGAPPYNEASYVPLPNPIILSNVGTYEDASGNNIVIYYFPYDGDQYTSLGIPELYYITVTDSAGTLQFTREAWPPNNGSGISPESETISYENQIANPTFTNTFLNPGIPNVFEVSATGQLFPLGPNWYFVCSGTGMVTVQQIALSGNDNVITNPPYVLDVTVSSGITQCWLRQRFFYNSGLWTSIVDDSVYLSASLVASNVMSGSAGISMYYSDSGNPDLQILTGNFGSPYTRLFGASPEIPQSNNPNTGKAGFVDIYLSFEAASHIRVSSIQVIPLLMSTPIIAQDFNSSNRNEAFQGDYYIPRLNAKPVDSYLVGWDFPLNPYQFGPTGGITTTAAYIIDQTIAQTSSSTAAWIPDPITQGLHIGGAAANSSLYLLQYLQGSEVANMFGNNLSVNVFAYGASSANPVTMQVYLFRSTGAGAIPALPTTIGTIAADGTFTLTASNWEAIPRSFDPNSDGLPTPEVTLSTVVTDADLNSGNNDYGFSGWQMNDVISDPTTTWNFAIVVTFAYVNASTGFTVNSISLVPGDIPCRPATKDLNEVLRQCQYYYQKSFFPQTAPAQNLGDSTGPSFGIQTSIASNPGTIGPIVRFPSPMRATPNIQLYNPNAANFQIRNISFGTDWSASTSINVSIQGFVPVGTPPAGSGIGDGSAVHWTADARNGIV